MTQTSENNSQLNNLLLISLCVLGFTHTHLRASPNAHFVLVHPEVLLIFGKGKRGLLLIPNNTKSMVMILLKC